MEVQLRDIPDEGLDLAFDLGAEPLEFLKKEGIGFEGPIPVQLSVLKVGEGALFVSGRINGRIALECVRCLKGVPFPLGVGVQAQYLSSESLKDQEECELRREEMDVVFYSGSTIRFNDLIQEQILLSIPMQSLCREDCRGLCPQCGQDCNTTQCGCRGGSPEPRFSVLKDYFKKDRR